MEANFQPSSDNDRAGKINWSAYAKYLNCDTTYLSIILEMKWEEYFPASLR